MAYQPLDDPECRGELPPVPHDPYDIEYDR